MDYLLNFLPQELVDKIDGMVQNMEAADIAIAHQEWDRKQAVVMADFKDSLVFNALCEEEDQHIAIDTGNTFFETLNMDGGYSYILPQLDEQQYDLASEYYFNNLAIYKANYGPAVIQIAAEIQANQM